MIHYLVIKLLLQNFNLVIKNAHYFCLQFEMHMGNPEQSIKKRWPYISVYLWNRIFQPELPSLISCSDMLFC